LPLCLIVTLIEHREETMKVAVITGASRGIGACVAEGLASDGYALAVAARSEDALGKVAERIKKNLKDRAPHVVAYPLDVRDHKAVEAMITSVKSEFGRIDLLFNNAGIAKLGVVDEVEIEDFEEVLSTNLKGAFYFLKAVVPVMKKQRSGTIINIASDAGKTGYAGWGAYCASKFGLVGLSESLYKELSPYGVKVTAICPGWVDTDIAEVSGLTREEMISPKDILSTVRWLLSLSSAAVVKELAIACSNEA